MELGRYSVSREIGRGGMGVVVRARSTEGRDVAIKVLVHPEARRSLTRFDRERRLLSELGEDAGFVPLIDSGESPSGPFLVMPFVGGGTLRDRLAKGRLELDETVEIGRALASALARAHARGIVHRDLKPENVLFTGEGRPLVADLGLAKHFRDDVPGAALSVSLSQHGEFTGTAGYMAPEQLVDSKSVSPAADVFSLGVLLFECLSGAPAFEGETIHELCARLSRGERKRVLEVRPDAPRWLARVVEHALSLPERDRFEDGAAFARALDEGPAGEHGRRPLAVPLAIALASVALASLVIFFVAGSRGSDAPGGQAPSTAADPGKKNSRPSSGEPRPKPPSDAAVFPDLCRGFLSSPRTKLSRVYGSYAWKHAHVIEALAVASDGARAISASTDWTLKVWDLSPEGPLGVPRGLELANLLGHSTGAGCVALARDGKRAISGGGDRMIRLWDLATFHEVLTLGGERGGVSAVAFLPGEKQAVSGRSDAVMNVWDLAEGRGLGALEGHEAYVSSVGVLRDGRHVVSGSWDGTVRLWEIGPLLSGEKTPVVPRTIGGHGDRVRSVAISPDERFALSASDDRVLALWDLRAALAAGEAGPAVRTFQGHGSSVRCAVFSPDGSQTISGSMDGTVRVWDTASGRQLRSIAVGQKGVHALALLPGGKRLLTGGTDRTIRCVDLEARAGEEVLPSPPGHRTRIAQACFSRDGERIISGSEDGTLIVWEARTGKPLARLPGEQGDVGCVAFFPDGAHAVSGGSDGTLRLWSTKDTNAPGEELGRHERQVYAVAVTPDGKRVVSASQDGTIALWDATRVVEGAPPLARLSGHQDEIHSVAVSRDGRKLLTSSEDRTVKLWDLERRAELRTFAGHGAGVLDAVFSEDEKLAVSSSADGRVKVWDIESGKETRTLEGHSSCVTGLALSRDAKLLVSVSWDRTIRLWDLVSGRELDVIDLATSHDMVDSVALAPDERSFIASTTRGVILRFDLVGSR